MAVAELARPRDASVNQRASQPKPAGARLDVQKPQFGEDGVINEIFRRIKTKNKICIEFGAWDGIHFSNTWSLWCEQDWRALLIEGDEIKYRTLVKNTAAFPKVTPVLAYVMPAGENSLDSIAERSECPADIDLLSIDIDGDDYYILEGLEKLNPRLTIIEYNPTIPPHVELVQQPGGYFGASALAILKLARKKNLKLVHMTDTNMFLLNEEAFATSGLTEEPLEKLFVYRHLVYVSSTYDGKTYLLGKSPYATFQPVKSKVTYPAVLNPNSVELEKVTITKNR